MAWLSLSHPQILNRVIQFEKIDPRETGAGKAHRAR
jgi:hypothetical protein